jgi:hypothetical protein
MKRKLRSFDAPGDWGGGGEREERERVYCKQYLHNGASGDREHILLA